jgi:hypothetical protein
MNAGIVEGIAAGFLLIDPAHIGPLGEALRFAAQADQAKKRCQQDTHIDHHKIT